MAVSVDFSRLKTSWTKYDIVRVMEVIYSVETIKKFKNKEAGIDEPILRSFLGIKSIQDPIPDYWIQIQSFPKEKKLFALFATIFTHWEVVNAFAEYYCTGDMKGMFEMEGGKQFTNIRSALVESGAAEPIYRRTQKVPFDFTPIFKNSEVGMLFKNVLVERVSRVTRSELTDSVFYDICLSYNFHKALSVSEAQFRSWLEGSSEFENEVIENNTARIIDKIEISNFFSVKDVKLDFKKAKEIYFLGENGDGKSLILMGLYLAFNRNFIVEKTDLAQTGKVVDILRSNRNKTTKLVGYDDIGQEYNYQNEIYLKNLFAYGTHRGRVDTDKPEEYGFMSLFDSEQTLTNPVTWLKDQELIELRKNKNLEGSLGDIVDIPASIPIKLLKEMFFEILEKNVEIKFEGSEVAFIEKGTELSFEELSEGYRSILIFVSDLLKRLTSNATDDQSPASLTGIVLVDEIDLHLHPKWQRVIIGKIRNLFPNIQFIFTTHSPTIIQGASEEAIIYRVYRNKDTGETKVSEPYLRKELDHLMINTLLTSPLFGLDDSRMNASDNESDTSDTYLLYRINRKLEEELGKQKRAGKVFIDDNEIDDLIQKILNEELDKK